MKRINLLQPTFDEKTIAELGDVLRSGWVMNGPKVKEFEEKFAEYVGAKYAIATNSCTSALDLCIKAHDITGGELVTTPMTFVSDAVVGEWNGMDVTFADIDPRTLCIDPETIQGNPKVIIAVNSHGRLANVKRIKERFPDSLVIEDAAHAMYTPGTGDHADITVWSFQAVKTLPIFDGGMITINDEEIAKKIRSLYWVGVEKLTYERVSDTKYTWDYDIRQNGIKGYMTDVQAVLGIGQLRRLEEMNQRRRDIQAKYNQAFVAESWCRIPAFSWTVQYYTPEWKDRDGLSAFLAENGIHTSVHFKPLNHMTYWKKADKHGLPVTDEVWPKLLSLPVHNALTDEDVDYVISKVREFYETTTA
jgi:perosamine synthetase